MKRADRLSLSESERDIMSIVRARGPIARSEITEFTTLSQQSVHRLVENLTEQKLLSSQKAVIKGRGKPSPQVVLDEASTYSLGVSVRPDNVQLIAVSLAGAELRRATLQSQPNDRESIMAEICRIAAEWSKTPEFRARTAIGVGVSIQGYRISKMNQFTVPLPTKSWSGIPIDDLFADALGIAAFTENNATCAAIAEHHNALGDNSRNMAFLSFNFGFGAGIVNNGASVIGGFGNAGELGVLIPDDEFKHRPALGELIKRLNDSGVELSGVPELQQKFDPSWPAVAEWLKEISPTLDLTIRAIRAIVDPEAIYFGGEAPAGLRNLLIDTCERPRENRYGEVLPFPELLPSRFNGDAAIYGAAILPARQLVF